MPGPFALVTASETTYASTTTSDGTSVTVTVAGGGTTTGSDLICAVAVRGGALGSSTLSLSDSAGNTWQNSSGQLTVVASGTLFAVFTCLNATAITTFTIHLSGGTPTTPCYVARLTEFSGYAGGSIDQSSTGTSGGTATTSVSAGTTAALASQNDLVFGADVNTGGSALTQTITAGPTLPAGQNSGGGFTLVVCSVASRTMSLLCAYNILTTSQAAQTFTVTLNSTQNYGAFIVAIEPPTGGPTANPIVSFI